MKKISDILRDSSNKRPLFSFEFFPPKNLEGEKRLFDTIDDLKSLNPDFVSVTYGAGGSTREKTLEWVTYIQKDDGITAMAHFTCVGASRDEIRSSLNTFYEKGIRNIMALRGDPPKGEGKFIPPADGFAHASELIAFIRETGLDFSIGGAAYPEVHPEAKTSEDDLKNLKKKVDAGTDFLVTQLFFDNRVYFKLIEDCKKIGINIPVIPGIMPITHFKQIEKFSAMAGTKIPDELVRELSQYKNEPEKLASASLRYSIKQVRELLDNGAPGIHFYTLNQSRAALEILQDIRKDYL